jgi:hypothetical protein
MKAKLVSESFKEDSDPIHDMDVGIRSDMIRIPQGWEKNVMDRLYKRYKTTEPSNSFNDWKIESARNQGDLVNVVLTQEFPNGGKNTDHLLLTPQQLKLFTKKYRNEIKKGTRNF